MALGWLCWRVWARLVAGDAAALCVFCVAGVALENIHLRFLWQAWHLWHWAVSGGALGRAWSPVTPPKLCVAGVALGDICLRFAWQAWHLWRQPPCFRVAGVALMALGGALGPVLVAGDAVALCVAGMALGNIYFRFVVLRGRRGTYGTSCQAWHLVTSTLVLGGRRGTWQHLPSFHVAGVALGYIQLRLAWQAWRLWHGRRGTYGGAHHLSHTSLSHTICHRPSFTHNFVTIHLPPTTLSHIIFHTDLVTHNFVTYIFHTLSFTVQ